MGVMHELLGGTTRGAVAGGMGAPVDAATLALNALLAGGGYAGHKMGLLQTPPELIENPVGGSEWIAGKMRGMGLLNDTPGTAADNWGIALGGLLGPLTAAKAPQIARGLLHGADNLAAPERLSKQAGAAFVGNRPKYMTDLADVLKSGEARDTPFGKITSKTEQQVNQLREVLGEPLIQRGDEWVIPKGVVEKFINKRIGSKVTPEQFVDDLNGAIHNTGNKVFQSKYPQNQGLLNSGDGKSNIAFVSVNPKTGDSVIKSGYSIETGRAGSLMSEGNKMLSAGGTQSTIVTTPYSEATGAFLPGYAESGASIVNKPRFVYPQDKALVTAQRNAALPIEQGGLGLGAENTAMERARWYQVREPTGG